MDQVKNQYGGQVVSQYDYLYDNLGRRERTDYSGSAFSGREGHSIWAYNDRSEIISAERYSGTEPLTPGFRSYEYDPIGNRMTATDGNMLVSNYTTNPLNRYSQIETDGNARPLDYDDDGNLLTTAINAAAEYNGENRLKSVVLNNVLCGDVNRDETVDLKDAVLTLQILSGENGVSGFIDLNRDANGDKKIGPEEAVYILQKTAGFVEEAEKQKIAFKYDYMGRRIEKSVYQHNGNDWNASPESLVRYVYDGWNVIAELDVAGSIERSFIWGLDLSKSFQGAGGRANACKKK